MTVLSWDAVPGDMVITATSGSWDYTSINWTQNFGLTNVTFAAMDSAVFRMGGGTIAISAPISVTNIAVESNGFLFLGMPLTVYGTITTLPGISTTFMNDFLGSVTLVNGSDIDFYGTLSGNLDMNGARVDNHGTIYGEVFVDPSPYFTAPADVFTNYGTILGTVHVATQTNNKGTIATQVEMSGNNVLFKNDATGTIGNPGTTITDGVGSNTIENKGQIYSNITMGSGLDTYLQKTGITYGNISMGSQDDIVRVEQNGTIQGYIDTGDGMDRVEIKFGTVGNYIDTGDWDDIVEVDAGGRVQADILTGRGEDSVTIEGQHNGVTFLQGGDDSYTAELAPDAVTVSGGGGKDTIIGGTRNDMLRGNSQGDSLTGGRGDDTLVGQAGQDSLLAGDHDDRILAGSGRDTLDGGAGNDTLVAGRGKDILTGGADADVFLYRTLDDIEDARGSDTILDFEVGVDILHLRQIDADITQGGNQRFDFIGNAAFSGTAGEVRQAGTANPARQFDVDGDGIADATLRLTGPLTLTTSDFVL